MSRDSELGQNLSGDFRKKISSDLNEIWYVGTGRWVMHDGMPYGRIQGQGQGQGHEPLKVWIPFIFKTYLLRHLFTMGAGKWPLILKLEHNWSGRIFDIFPSFLCHVTLNLEENVSCKNLI